MRLIPAACPSCGATLELPEDLKVAHCVYCGARVIIDSEVKTVTATPCRRCKETGKCLPYEDEYGSTVYTCSGTGKCPGCAGFGKIAGAPCSLCGGDGRCWCCKGSGKCLKCNGSGRVTA